MRRMSRATAAIAACALSLVGVIAGPAAADTANVTLAARNAAAGSIVYLTASVTPSPFGGNVRFDSDQGQVGTAPVIFGKAEMWFVPTTTGAVTVTARFTSFDGGTTGASAPLVITVPGGTSVSLSADGTLTVGTVTTLRASINPATGSGRVTFGVDGANVGTSPVSNGVATLTWKPAAAGQHTLTARYSGGAVDDAITSTTVTVIPAGGQGGPKPDVIVVDPAGNLTPWVPGGSVTLANGARRQLVASAASGAPVTLAVAGPCSLSNNVLSIDAGSNTCTLTAVSPGGNGYGSAVQTFGIILAPGQQQADLQAPPSGRVARNSSFLLGPRDQLTNLGRSIVWTVTRGKARVCTVARSGTAARLRIAGRAGTCAVRARAAGIPGQWRNFTATRTYRVR